MCNLSIIGKCASTQNSAASLKVKDKSAPLRQTHPTTPRNKTSFVRWLKHTSHSCLRSYPTVQLSSSVSPNASNTESCFGRRSPVNSAEVPDNMFETHQRKKRWVQVQFRQISVLHKSGAWNGHNVGLFVLTFVTCSCVDLGKLLTNVTCCETPESCT